MAEIESLARLMLLAPFVAIGIVWAILTLIGIASMVR